ncbi:MAG: aminopeptidase, partial [Peptostreptococcaceae bacterium]|nr:aminopeptidase [Peptostreptococcaceae bacterium]
MSFEKNLDKYAKLAIKVGVNIQEGQTLLVRSPIECAPFVRKVVKHAYEAGAKNGIFEVDEVTLKYVKEYSSKSYTVYKADEDAVYEQVIEIDLLQTVE